MVAALLALLILLLILLRRHKSKAQREQELYDKAERARLRARDFAQAHEERQRRLNDFYFERNLPQSKAYLTLGLHEGASAAAIKAAYKSLMKSYHPDAIAAKGLNEEEQRRYKDKYHEINEAYLQLKELLDFV